MIDNPVIDDKRPKKRASSVLAFFMVCGGASPSCRRNPLALGSGGSQLIDKNRLIAKTPT